MKYSIISRLESGGAYALKSLIFLLLLWVIESADASIEFMKMKGFQTLTFQYPAYISNTTLLLQL